VFESLISVTTIKASAAVAAASSPHDPATDSLNPEPTTVGEEVEQVQVRVLGFQAQELPLDSEEPDDGSHKEIGVQIIVDILPLHTAQTTIYFYLMQYE
jgi:hypothetical protein